MKEPLKKYKFDDVKHPNTLIALNTKLDIKPNDKSMLEKF